MKKELNSNLTINDLIMDGFTKKMAQCYLQDMADDLKNPYYDKDMVEWAHSKGILAKNVSSWGIDDSNCDEYWSDYDWYRVWPLNSWQRIWINDKLTLKYMLNGTEYENMLPEYYFYMSSDGLRELTDNPYKGCQSVDTLLAILRDKKKIAAKPNNGSLAMGFCLLSYCDGSYCINGKTVSEDELRTFINVAKNYIFTEYLTPCEPFKSIDPKIHTLRMFVMNPCGNDPKVLDCASIRYSTDAESGVNYTKLNSGASSDAYNMYSHLNIHNGEIDKTKLLYPNKAVITHKHPITGVCMDTRIPNYDKLLENVKGIASYLFGVEWMGFDICMTDKGFQMMEINSHPGHTSTQLFGSILWDNNAREYIERKLNEIDKLDVEEKIKRSNIVR